MQLKHRKLRHTQGCLTDCVAYYFGVHPNKVPFFIKPTKGWYKRFQRYFSRRGLKCSWVDYKPTKNLIIAVGKSSTKKGWYHAVVYKGGKKIYDPSPKPVIMGRPVSMFKITKKNKK